MYYGYGNGYNASTNNGGGSSIGKWIVYGGILVVVIIAALFVPKMFETPKKYTVTFMDLEGVYLVQENIKEKTTITEPPAPSKKGYQFLGWYLDESEYDFSKPVTSDLYLRAKWLNSNTQQIEEV